MGTHPFQMQTEQKTKKAPATSNSHLGTHPFQVQTEQKTKKGPATFKSHLGTHPFQVQTEHSPNTQDLHAALCLLWLLLQLADLRWHTLRHVHLHSINYAMTYEVKQHATSIILQ